MNTAQRAEKVLDLIRQAALAEKKCPTNKELGKFAGIDAQHLIGLLVRAGTIAIENRGKNVRRVTIVAEGISTAMPPEWPGGPARRLRRAQIVQAEKTVPSHGNTLDLVPLRVGPPPRTCRFIHNEDAKHPNYCGEPVERESYCQAHYDRCHTKRVKTGRLEQGFVLFKQGVAA